MARNPKVTAAMLPTANPPAIPSDLDATLEFVDASQVPGHGGDPGQRRHHRQQRDGVLPGAGRLEVDQPDDGDEHHGVGDEGR